MQWGIPVTKTWSVIWSKGVTYPFWAGEVKNGGLAVATLSSISIRKSSCSGAYLGFSTKISWLLLMEQPDTDLFLWSLGPQWNLSNWLISFFKYQCIVKLTASFSTVWKFTCCLTSCSPKSLIMTFLIIFYMGACLTRGFWGKESWRPTQNGIQGFYLNFSKELCYGYLMFEGFGKIPLGRLGKRSALLAVSV